MPSMKEIYKELVNIFAPVVYLDSSERFFPVDLTSTLTHSKIYSFEDRTATLKYSSISTNSNENILDEIILKSLETNCFTTVGNFDMIDHKLDINPPEIVKVPKPNLEKIFEEYSTGELKNAVPTIYATVNEINQYSQIDLLDNQFDDEYKQKFKDFKEKIKDGILINYYFYFPACETKMGFIREGDWSGISILLKNKPQSTTDLYNVKDPFWNQLCKNTDFQPIACCFSKDGDNFNVNAIKSGFRLWSNVNTIEDSKITLPLGDFWNTHPVIYISKGLHNCYYNYVDNTIDISIKSDDVSKECPNGPFCFDPPLEEPQNRSSGILECLILIGLLVAGFTITWIINSCTDDDKDEKKNNDITTSNILQTIPDKVDNNGNVLISETVNNSSISVNKRKSLVIKYIDLEDSQTKAIWNYKGFWGAARSEIYLNSSQNEIVFGNFGGFKRPNLESWFLWNLYNNL